MLAGVTELPMSILILHNSSFFFQFHYFLLVFLLYPLYIPLFLPFLCSLHPIHFKSPLWHFSFLTVVRDSLQFSPSFFKPCMYHYDYFFNFSISHYTYLFCLDLGLWIYIVVSFGMNSSALAFVYLFFLMYFRKAFYVVTSESNGFRKKRLHSVQGPMLQGVFLVCAGFHSAAVFWLLYPLGSFICRGSPFLQWEMFYPWPRCCVFAKCAVVLLVKWDPTVLSLELKLCRLLG